MQITAEEKLMYSAMKAIYDSNIPVDFKGSMVLKACLLEAGFSEEIRKYGTRLISMQTGIQMFYRPQNR